jgi:hypothetical protein
MTLLIFPLLLSYHVIACYNNIEQPGWWIINGTISIMGVYYWGTIVKEKIKNLMRK